MKRFLTGLSVALLAVSLSACGGSGGSGSTAATKSANNDPAAGTPEAILDEIQGDFNDTAQKLYDDQQSMFSEVGETYDSYIENKQLVQDWYDLTISETEELNARTQENSEAYFQAVIDSVDTSDSDAVDDAIDDFYDAIYDDAYGDYYDTVYDDLYDDAYDQYYDGIISDALDGAENYGEVYDALSTEYKALSDGRSGVYEAIADGRSEIYEICSNARSAEYSDEFTMDEIFRESVVNIQKDDKAGDEQSEPSTDSEAGKVAEADAETNNAGSVAGVSSDFKATMDQYEAFFDKYVEFMNAYDANSGSPELIAQYASMMSEYADTMEALDSIDGNSLSTADYAYYTEVMARITAKLAEVGQ